MTFLATWPFLNRISVGIERTSYVRRRLLVLVDVELHDLQVLALAGDLLEHGRDDAARAAPGRPEVDEDRLVGLDDLGLEVGVGDFGDGAGHGVGLLRSGSCSTAHYTKCSAGPRRRRDRRRLRPGARACTRRRRQATRRATQKVRPDEDLDERRWPRSTGTASGDRHEGRRQQLVPGVPAAGDDPRRERQEERRRARAARAAAASSSSSAGAMRSWAASVEAPPPRTSAWVSEREGRRARRRRRSPRGRPCRWTRAPEAAVVLGLQRQRGAGDEAGDAGHRVQGQHERVAHDDPWRRRAGRRRAVQARQERGRWGRASCAPRRPRPRTAAGRRRRGAPATSGPARGRGAAFQRAQRARWVSSHALHEGQAAWVQAVLSAGGGARGLSAHGAGADARP